MHTACVHDTTEHNVVGGRKSWRVSLRPQMAGHMKNVFLTNNKTTQPTMPTTASGGGKKPRAKSASKPKPKSAKSSIAGYTKTARKDAKGRVIYKDGKGEDKVRCKTVSGVGVCKMTWRKPSTTTQRKQKGGDFRHEEDRVRVTPPETLKNILTEAFNKLDAQHYDKTYNNPVDDVIQVLEALKGEPSRQLLVNHIRSWIANRKKLAGFFQKLKNKEQVGKLEKYIAIPVKTKPSYTTDPDGNGLVNPTTQRYHQDTAYPDPKVSDYNKMIDEAQVVLDSFRELLSTEPDDLADLIINQLYKGRSENDANAIVMMEALGAFRTPYNNEHYEGTMAKVKGKLEGKMYIEEFKKYVNP